MEGTRFQARLQFQDATLRLEAGAPSSSLVYDLGFWSAGILTALCALELGIQGVLFATLAGGVETNPAYYLSQAAALLTAPFFIVLMACLFPLAADVKKIFALVALAFAVVYAALGGINYYVQLTAVRMAMLNAELSLIAPFFMPNLSVMFAFDILGYFFMTLSTLAAIPLFTGAGLERAIRWVLALNFGVGIAAVIGNLIADPLLLLPILPATWIAAGVATALLAVWFHRARRPRALMMPRV